MALGRGSGRLHFEQESLAGMVIAMAGLDMVTLANTDLTHSLPSHTSAGKTPLLGGVERKEPRNAPVRPAWVMILCYLIVFGRVQVAAPFVC